MRYLGPIFKKSRRYGISLLENDKEFSKGKKRTYAPGQHGNKRVKLSDYGQHLYEKQKVRFLYGLSEKQLHKVYNRAIKMKGVAGTNLLQLLESRFDNLVFRAGFATTRRQARQLVNHGHFLLNGRNADIPSMHISVGDTITLKTKSQNNAQIKAALESKPAAAWMTVKNFEAKFDRLPDRTELNQNVKENFVIEHYSK
ncbi:30S ribosomal protein S4 [Mycoplasma tauri]|uniref:Small ribosomal subunit protein uS4 n=2 Tax=Mycoplasma tauri TaxID=547987 RepID=A0A953T6Q8_9MOLU|nr:30S ribosomal protein S4 [Mycoplasma tauri]MBZ4195436.1 30S ribosomal protein S4 [Mycoplasma tauri]MBZ4203939.1 30S ribosomal protein S4 [Mycoplasma tauri]MBZ4204364.1 30S ribosomal protein S4 [Mycoplasma tauri]MBZ4218451.1 30S ribosomal protein S4 [Mycoplasma tauri]QSB07826.1 30S ribosomal protein S4 [Mycoplasma tauri]